MNYNQAKRQLQEALDNQQTISIPKLKKLMQSLNMSLEGNNKILVLKKKKGKPTVIHVDGRRYVYDPKG